MRALCRVLADPLAIDADGCLSVPRVPGLGAAIDETAVARLRLT